MKIRSAIIAFTIFITFNICYGQSSKFKLDTLVDSYFVKIRVYNKTFDSPNIKSSFSFYDTTSRNLKFYYSFKYLPSNKDKPGCYVPILTDCENDVNSNYLWQDIQYDLFDYGKAKEYVFEQLRNKSKIQLEDYSSIEKGLKEKAKNEFIRTFNALINKDYLTFAKSIHPATLKDSSYSITAEYYKSINLNNPFKFTSVRVNQIDTLINFNGEIQILFYAFCGYIDSNKKGELKKTMIARSFDEGKNWYFLEFNNYDIDSEIKKSKGNLASPAISPELLVLIK